MKDRIREALRSFGLFNEAREVLERGRVLRRLLQFSPPYPLHRSEPVEPFFIVGSGRCGTTLLRRILMANKEVYIPPENWNFHSTILRYRRYRWVMDWEDLARLTVNRFAYQGTYQAAQQGIANRWFDAYSLDPVITELSELPEAKRSLACMVDRLYGYHGHLQEATFTRWGEKFPYNVYFMPTILEVFPRAKFIHLLRDGTDVVSSWLKMGDLYDLPGRALRWKSSVISARKFMEKHPTRLLEVRYENMVRHPASTTKDVCRFLSLSFSPSMLEDFSAKSEMGQISQLSFHENVFKPVSSSYIGKGHRTLTNNQKKKIADLIGDVLEQCGYEIPGQ